VNDNVPVFSAPSYHTSVNEDMSLYTSVYQINATDADIGAAGKIVGGKPHETLNIIV